MGRLMEDMTRLAEEVQALHGSRRAFRKELSNSNQERQMDVFEMCVDFAETQERVAKRAKEERLAFLKHLRRTVGGQRRETGADLVGARHAWAGRDA